ncbi:hypothetical protein [Actinomycetospora aeridis]|uniref:Uncharacterized protein n=1 Tax=Actinomycetospora aeridis TaxID=3129231 RepID=A0ABU8NED1_9PSEU
MDGLSLSALKGEQSMIQRAEDEKVVRAYLRLCEDQCEMRCAGWIGDATWRIWADGMSDQLGTEAGEHRGREPFVSVWRPMIGDETQYKLLQALLRGEFQEHQPSLVKRLLNGLYGRSGV